MTFTTWFLFFVTEIALAIVADLTARRNGASLTATIERPANESAACPLARAA